MPPKKRKHKQRRNRRQLFGFLVKPNQRQGLNLAQSYAVVQWKPVFSPSVKKLDSNKWDTGKFAERQFAEN